MMRPLSTLALLCSLGVATAPVALPAQDGSPASETLFDGKTLAGWRGDQRLWTVEDGAIKGSTLDHKIDSNTFLIWEGEDVADFELRFEAKFTPANNSGVQYRSRPFDSNPYGVAGNQFDLHPSPNYLAMLYGERERGIVAQRGQRVVVGEDGKSKVVGATNPATPVDVSQWHSYRIVARGNHLVHEVDGVVAVDITDHDPKARRSGLIALQLHQGAPMNVWFRNLELTRFAAGAATASSAAAAPAETAEEPATAPHWIWSGASDGERASFRRAFEVAGNVALASLHAAADNHCEVWLNGQKVLNNDDWAGPSQADVKAALRQGRNVLAVHAWNEGGPAALALRLWIRGGDEQDTVVVSDGSWKAIAASGPDGWRDAGFDDSTWGSPTDLGEVGSAGQPWSGSVGPTSFGARPTPPKPQTVRDAEIQTLPGFVAELVYEVPRDSQGSWVSLGTLPDGSLIASDQADKGLFRIRPAAVGVPGATTSVTRIPVEIGGAQGLLWAFDSLYVMVNGRGSGLYRITDEDGDGELDAVQLLRKLEGAGEHGPHAVRLSPDGAALVVCAGNHTNPPEIDASRIPTNWSEDLLLPRQWDARGHARGRMAPGGWIARVSPDGAHWEMLSVGYRNQYDFAFHHSGEMFAYDADMEWDMGMPWYRPTRIVHATSGSEFGWRSGTGKWPTDYPDSLPPLLEVGPGSPTGLTFGYGAQFPPRYEQALYALDWTFGTIWAIHLEPDGASYRATSEEFASGKPLALTDAVVGADGALYFTVGGRGTQSKLYRIRHESAAPSSGPALALTTPEASLRKQLEAFHGKVDPAAVDAAWPALGHRDRFVAYAARIALESQPVAGWRERALAETDPAIASNALLALARQGSGADDRDAVLRKLMGLRGPFGGEFGVVSRLRTAGVAMARHGMPDEELRQQMIELLSNNLRPRNKRIFVEMVKLLAYLGAPTVVEQAMPMLVAAEPSPAPAWSELIQRNDGYGGPIAKMLADMPPLEGIDLAFALRNVRYGWTLPLRRQYFEFINRAAKHPGGASYAGFLTNCRNEALKNCSFFERAACSDLTGEELAAKPDFEITAPRGPGRAWTLDDAVAAVEAGQGPRDFAAGRNLFHAVACVACHRFDGAGGDIGPDLTTVANKFSTRDLLTSIVDPSQVISDQYGSSIVTRKDGTEVFGRVNEKDGGDLEVYPMDPNADPVQIPAADVAAVKASPISQMPQGLINSLSADELRDLIAYLMSRGDENAPAYRR